MPVIINGTTGLSGVSTVNLANGSVTQNILANGVAGTGPAFMAYRSTNQTGISSNTLTKVQVNTEEYDTNNNYDPTINYRFTPTVAGFYQINAVVYLNGSGMTAPYCAIFKNGASHTVGSTYNSSASVAFSVASDLVYCNGSTDYIELYAAATVSSGTVTFAASTTTTIRFSGFLARAA